MLTKVGDMTREVTIILPNTHKLWIRGISLSVYSRSYDYYSQIQEFSRLGKLVHDYKYLKYLKPERRREIIEECSKAVVDELHIKQSPVKESFNCLISVPPNINKDISLPDQVATALASEFTWLRNCSNAIAKSREIPSIKTTDKGNRSEAIKGAYSINPSLLPEDICGFLIIDDIYDTGSTVREIARTLKREFPEIPRYVITLTHLRSVWGA